MTLGLGNWDTAFGNPACFTKLQALRKVRPAEASIIHFFGGCFSFAARNGIRRTIRANLLQPVFNLSPIWRICIATAEQTGGLPSLLSDELATNKAQRPARKWSILLLDKVWHCY